MLIVKTKLALSKVHGIGLFADQNINKGELIWELTPLTTDFFTYEDFLNVCSKLSVFAIHDYLNYSYTKQGKVHYIKDNARFINHSTSPNIAFLEYDKEFALRDIHKGEELFENYKDLYDENDFFFAPHLFKIEDKNELINVMRNHFANHK